MGFEVLKNVIPRSSTNIFVKFIYINVVLMRGTFAGYPVDAYQLSGLSKYYFHIADGGLKDSGLPKATW